MVCSNSPGVGTPACVSSSPHFPVPSSPITTQFVGATPRGRPPAFTSPFAQAKSLSYRLLSVNPEWVVPIPQAETRVRVPPSPNYLVPFSPITTQSVGAIPCGRPPAFTSPFTQAKSPSHRLLPSTLKGLYNIAQGWNNPGTAPKKPQKSPRFPLD